MLFLSMLNVLLPALLINISCLPAILGEPIPYFNTTSKGSRSNATNVTDDSPRDSAFPFLIPFDTKQSCDIYGPLCQPGLITANSIGSDRRTSLISLPCSSYLSAQSTYIRDSNATQQQEWLTQFGRSPQCHSFAGLLSNQQSTVPLTFSECQADVAVATTAPTNSAPGSMQIPDGLLSPKSNNCCGQCDMVVPELRLYYFEDPNAEAWCSAHGRQIARPSVAANDTSNPDAKKRRRRGEIVLTATGGNAVNTAVVSGHTLTSPSMYLEVIGTLTVTDDCGMVGTPLVNPFIAVPSGGLTTEEPQSFKTGEIGVGHFAGMQFTDVISKNWNSGMGPDFLTSPFIFKSLNVAELECPTVGVGFTEAVFLSDNQPYTETYTTIGPPWLPYIKPPVILSTLQPQWIAQCSGRFFAEHLGVFDPPRVLGAAAPQKLVPGATIHEVPNPTPVGPLEQTKPQNGAKPIDVRPLATQSAGSFGSGAKAPSTNGLVSHGSPKGDEMHEPAPNKGLNHPAAPPKAEEKPESFNQPAGQGSNIDPAKGGQANKGSPKIDGQQGKTQGQGIHPSGGQPESAADPVKPDLKKGPANEETPQVQNKQPENEEQHEGDPGGSVGHPFSNAETDITGSEDNPQDSAIKGGSRPGQSPADKGGQQPEPNGADHETAMADDIAEQTGKDRGVTGNVAENSMTVGGQIFVPAKAGFAVGGKMIKPGGSAVTIDHTPISLGPTGVLHVGSHTISLKPSAQGPLDPASQSITAGGQTFAAAATGFAVGGQMIRPGGSAITIDHTPISLGPSGILKLGSQTISLNPPFQPVVTPAAFTVAGHTITPDLTGFVVAGKTVLPGGTPVSISGTRVSLGPSGQLVLGTLTTSLSSVASSEVLTVGGQAITPNPHGFTIAGKTVLPGETPVTVSGTRISLGTSGQLVIGSMTTQLKGQALPTAVTIGGQTITPAPIGFVIDGKTVSPEGPPVTISGTRVSLGSSGELIIGSRTTFLPTDDSSASIATQGGAQGGDPADPNGGTSASASVEAFEGASTKMSAPLTTMIFLTMFLISLLRI